MTAAARKQKESENAPAVCVRVWRDSLFGVALRALVPLGSLGGFLFGLSRRCLFRGGVGLASLASSLLAVGLSPALLSGHGDGFVGLLSWFEHVPVFRVLPAATAAGVLLLVLVVGWRVGRRLIG